MGLILKNSIRCKKCNSVIESESQYDCKRCTCGAVFVDGGFYYCRYGGKDLEYVENLSIIIDEDSIGDVTVQETDTELIFDYKGESFVFSKIDSTEWKFQRQQYYALLDKW